MGIASQPEMRSEKALNCNQRELLSKKRSACSGDSQTPNHAYSPKLGQIENPFPAPVPKCFEKTIPSADQPVTSERPISANA